jgi:hypothetical protein
MKITIDVKRAEQSFDLDMMAQQNYLVVEFAGQELRIPCNEEQMGAAIRECMGHTQTVPPPESRPPSVPILREFSYVPVETEQPEVSEDKPVHAAPAVFVVPEPKPVQVPQQLAGPGLRPVARKPTKASDDAGISQG